MRGQNVGGRRTDQRASPRLKQREANHSRRQTLIVMQCPSVSRHAESLTHSNKWLTTRRQCKEYTVGERGQRRAAAIFVHFHTQNPRRIPTGPDATSAVRFPCEAKKHVTIDDIILDYRHRNKVGKLFYFLGVSLGARKQKKSTKSKYHCSNKNLNSNWDVYDEILRMRNSQSLSALFSCFVCHN